MIVELFYYRSDDGMLHGPYETKMKAISAEHIHNLLAAKQTRLTDDEVTTARRLATESNKLRATIA